VVARVRKVCGTRAVGHAGTLDPFATGLLVVLLGRATRLARFVEQQPKTYLGTARLGIRTATDDRTGAVIAEAPAAWRVERGRIEQALAAFRGPQLQRPPAFSAKKVEGRRSYALARRGEPAELREVQVTIYSIEAVAIRFPDVTFRTTVSPGTYIRAIARDLGDRLGGGAHLVELRREAVGPLRVEDAVRLEDLAPGTPILPPLAVLGHLPRVEVGPEDTGRLAHGRTIRPSRAPAGVVALVAEGRLVAVGESGPEGIHPVVVLEAA